MAWGDNRFGQTSVPEGLSNVTAIAAGEFHSVALKSEGTVVVWGENGSVPAGLNSIFAIAAGGNSTLALVGRPSLQTRILGGHFILAWPSWAQAFSLQTSSNLTDVTAWTIITNTSVVVDREIIVTNPATDGQRFYRLMK